MKFQVWHAMNPNFGMGDHRTYPEQMEHVANCEADDQDHAFKLLNNGVPGGPDCCWDNPEVTLVVEPAGIRSLSVGDVLVDEEGKVFRCEGVVGWVEEA